GMVPAATGTQTAGSIVRPASFCGVYAMKPSFGTIPRTGMLKTTDSLDTVGFFTVYQRDLRRMFDAMRVHGKNYPISHAALGDETRQHKGKQRPWRVGFARTHTWDYASKAAKDALERFIHTLATHQGVAVADAPLPKIMEKTHETHATIYDKSLSYYFQNEYAEADFLSPIMNELIERGAAITIEDFKIAIDLQTSMIYKMDAYFGDFDILISLSTAGEAPARNKTELPDPALMWTLTHLPVVSAPVFTSENGLPFGIQIVARKYNDYLLLEFLGYLESLGMIPARSMYARERQGYQNKK
ncbi:MAG: amidase, partial [bacterium]|nr:amidase [bacterium]